jgi:diadenosine tetraphosphate (Ap4A) HIT family hydrolase
MAAVESKKCLFCEPTDENRVLENEFCYATWDSYPVSKGHMLLVPFRHVIDYFSATDAEKAALWTMLDRTKVLLDRRFEADGYNVGINIGQAAGQSVFHLHVHVIPRSESIRGPFFSARRDRSGL